MVTLSKIISSTIESSLRKVKALVYGANGRNTHFESMPFGEDSVPIEGLRAIVVQSETREDRFVLGYINKNQKASAGDKRIYSMTSDGVVATDIWLKSDGTIEVGGDSDFMVRYSALETAFNELKADHNNLAQKWDQFATAYVPGSPAATGLPPTASTAGQSSADITGAKIEEIKTA